MSLLFIVMIVVIVILLTKNNNLKNENNSLKTNTVFRKNFCPKCGFNFKNNIVNFCPKCGHSFIGVVPPVNKEVNVTPKHTDKEIKNSLILIIGSILVVIAAIVFLSSTWDSIHNIIKTGVMIFMLVVFLAISYVSDKHFNLKQTSKAFYYISLAYIPIILISISMFSLFGNYLSLYGKGKYIYLTISSILVALIYYLNSKNKDSRLIFSFSIIFQILSIIFLTLIFTNNISVIIMGLIIYSLIISICYIMNKTYFDKNIHLNLCNICCINLALIVLPHNFFSAILNNIFTPIFNNYEIFNIISCILLFINIYLVVIKIYNKNEIYKFIYPLLIILIFNNVGYFFDNVMFRQSLILVAFAVICIYNILRENKINIISYIEILVSFSLFNLVWMISRAIGVNVLDSYILFGVVTFLSLVYYMYSEKHKTFSSIMLGIGIVITSINIAIHFELESIILGIVSFILILISMFKKTNTSLKNGFKWVGIISLFAVTLFFGAGLTIYNLILCLVYSIVLIGYGIKNKDDIYKIFSYLYINIILFQLFDFLNISHTIFIIPATTVILTFIERLFPTIRNKTSDTYLIISYIVSTLALLNTIDDYNFIAMTIVSLTFIYYIFYNKKSREYLCVPFIGMIPHIYFSNVLIIGNFNIMYVVSILALIGLCMLIYYKKCNLYITMFYLYMFFHLITLEEITYISLFMLIVGSICCYLVKNNKVKDIYKVFIYILCLSFYGTLITDLGLSNISSLTFISYLIFVILLTRTVFKKYGNGYKVWEYILCIFINFVALFSYRSEFDGLIYVIFLTILVIVAYILRFGPVFIVCLISILINVVLLTRTFWINIPWWLYILLIGSILIGFAIYNEIRDKSKNNKINYLKDHLDL